jgi:hypothetical protein
MNITDFGYLADFVPDAGISNGAVSCSGTTSS